jgi:hypothetical protein
LKRLSLIFTRMQKTTSVLIGNKLRSSNMNSSSLTSRRERWSNWGNKWRKLPRPAKRVGRRPGKVKRSPKNPRKYRKLKPDCNYLILKPAKDILLKRSPVWDKMVYESLWTVISRLWKASTLKQLTWKFRSHLIGLIYFSWDPPIPIGKGGLTASKNIHQKQRASRRISRHTFPASTK